MVGRLGQKEQRRESCSEETRTAPPGSHQSCTGQAEAERVC